MTHSSLYVLVCSTLISGCFAGPEPEEETDIFAQELAIDVGLAADHTCGNKVVEFRANKKAPKRAVFFVPDTYTWHKNNPCLGDLMEAAKGQPPGAPIYDLLYHQSLYILSNPNVRFYAEGGKKRKLSEVTNDDGTIDLTKFNRIVYRNEHGLAYDSMSQVDFGSWLLSADRRLLEQKNTNAHYNAAFKAMGLAALDVITDPVSDGGLRSRSKCAAKPSEHCSFFHSVTKRNLESTKAGATLNKALHPVRDLFKSATILEDIKKYDADPSLPGRIAAYKSASREGAYQLVYNTRSNNGSPPNLFDFFAEKNGDPIVRSWLYYGFRTDLDEPYFLDGADGPWKNCNYHFHVMELLAKILPDLQADGADLEGFRETRDSLGMSVLDFLVKTYEEKKADGLKEDSKGPAPGMFGGCRKRKLEEGVDVFLKNF